VSHALHLTRRFFGALWPGPPRARELDWVADVLHPDEYILFRRLPNHDQRHLIRVARRVQSTLAQTEHADDTRWLAAALLHDVGKHDARLGPYGRAVATICGRLGGPEMPYAWSGQRGFTRRVGLYLRHGELGSDMIRLAHGREEAALWSEAHNRHDLPERLGFPQAVVDALLDADG